MFKLDLFNKKKIKKLEQEVYSLNNDIEGYIKNERNWSKQIDNMEKISTKIMEENHKLINWIMKILDTVGTMEVREKSNFKIQSTTIKKAVNISVPPLKINFSIII